MRDESANKSQLGWKLQDQLFVHRSRQIKVTVERNGGHVLGSPFTSKGQLFQVRLVLSLELMVPLLECLIFPVVVGGGGGERVVGSEKPGTR